MICSICGRELDAARYRQVAQIRCCAGRCLDVAIILQAQPAQPEITRGVILLDDATWMRIVACLGARRI